MKIGLVSDLHLEFLDQKDYDILLEKINNSDCDIIINAGDTHPNQKQRHLFNEQITKPYHTIKGNHDCYGEDFDSSLYTEKIDNLKFLFCTMWTNFRGNNESMNYARKAINDFNFIKDVSPIKMMNAYYDSIQKIKEYKPDIIVSHFAPLPTCVNGMYAGSPLNNYYVNDIEENLVLDSEKIYYAFENIKLILHGHCHINPTDRKYKRIRVVSNTLGYVNEIFHDIRDYQVKIIEIK